MTAVVQSGNDNGVFDYVSKVAVDGNGNVYAGGEFTQASGAAANRVAKWNGANWLPLGTGTNRVVSSLATGQNGKLYAGESFTTTGDGSKIMVHFGIYDPNAP